MIMILLDIILFKNIEYLPFSINENLLDSTCALSTAFLKIFGAHVHFACKARAFLLHSTNFSQAI